MLVLTFGVRAALFASPFLDIVPQVSSYSYLKLDDTEIHRRNLSIIIIILTIKRNDCQVLCSEILTRKENYDINW